MPSAFTTAYTFDVWPIFTRVPTLGSVPAGIMNDAARMFGFFSTRIEIDSVFYAPSSFTLTPRDGEPEVFALAHEGNGLRHQAAEVARCVAAGQLESPILPLAETVAIMGTLDAVRRQIGLTYPGE